MTRPGDATTPGMPAVQIAPRVVGVAAGEQTPSGLLIGADPARREERYHVLKSVPIGDEHDLSRKAVRLEVRRESLRRRSATPGSWRGDSVMTPSPLVGPSPKRI